MPLVRMPVNSLLGGVSQQAPAVRQADQCERQENVWCSPVLGATKRHPLKWVKKLIASASSNWRYHIIDRGATEQYLLVFKGDVGAGVTAYPLVDVTGYTAGTAMVVQDPGSILYAYLGATTGTPFSNLRVHTVADYTFVVNNKKITAMDTGTLTTTKPFNTEAYIFVRSGNYKSNYKVRIKSSAGTDQTITVKTWSGNTTIAGSTAIPAITNTELNTIKTDDIAEELKLRLDNAWTGVNSYACTRKGSVLKVTFNTVAQAIEPVDSVGDSSLSVVWKEVPRVSAYLPTICSHGFIIKIIGDQEIQQDDYFVKFVADEGTGVFGRGHWQEDLDYSQPYNFDASTMPHALIRAFDDGTYGVAGTITGTVNAPFFRWVRPGWDNKLTANTVLNPQPSFIGRKIENIFFYKERLGFLAEDRVIMSETGHQLNFWRTTMLVLEDSAPIDVINNHSPIALCKSATPYNEGVILKSSRDQFVLRGGDILSPRTVTITRASAFENFDNVDSMVGGRSLFFGFKRGDFSGLREFYQVNDLQLYDSQDASIQTPNYIVGDIQHIAVSTLEETVIVKGSEANVVYIYKYLWNGQTKLLSSWGKWIFSADATIRYFKPIDNIIYFINEYGDGIHLEKIDLATGLTDTSATFVTELDRRIDQSQVSGMSYNAGTGRTTFTFPFTIPTSWTYPVTPLVVQKITGTVYTYVSNTASTVTVVGDCTGINFWFGLSYDMRYGFTKPHIKLPAGRGLVPETGCVQRVKTLEFQYQDSGLFLVYVTIGNRAVLTYYVNLIDYTNGAVLYNSAINRTDKARIPIHGRADELTVEISNPSPYPCNISSAIWELVMYEAGQRIA